MAVPWFCFLLLLGVPLTQQASVAVGLRNVSDPEVQQAAKVAVKTFNDRNNCIYYFWILQSLSVQLQVGPRSLLYLTMELVQTLCMKNQEDVHPEECPLPPPSEQQKVRCDFLFWYDPKLEWRVIDFRCNSSCH